jgi:hypothetical protein
MGDKVSEVENAREAAGHEAGGHEEQRGQAGVKKTKP